MQPLTEQQTQRVWSRVMNAQAVPAAQMNEQTGSGSAAIATLLTDVAAARAPRPAPKPLKKSLLEFI